MSLDRREFLRQAGARTGLLLTGAGFTRLTSPESGQPRGPALGRNAADVVVIGAGAFGVWTSLYLREMGPSVRLVDAYGPGNSRSTSGGETRGVRSSYGDRITWVRWANEAIRRWSAWDETWGSDLKLRLFYQTGDLILRPDWGGWLTGTRESWDALGTPYEEISVEEVRYRYPQVNPDGFEVAVVEPNAGVVRARRACEAVAEVFRLRGGEVVIDRATPGGKDGDRLLDVSLASGGTLSADTFVFALGPWFPKVFPSLMRNRLRIPIGHVFYYGTPPGDNRFTFPNMPSYNVPGITGWPALPPDYRGFRVRTGGRAAQDPDTSVRWIGARYLERPRRFLAERFPALANAPLIETRACHYESSVDRNFIVDRHPDYSNVWLAGAGSAEGFKFGPVVGEYVAQRVLGRNGDPELAAEFSLKEEEFDTAALRRIAPPRWWRGR